MICKLYANDMHDVITHQIFYFFMGKLKKDCTFRKYKKIMDLLSFVCSFKCCKNFLLKINFSESNFLDVYAVAHYSFVQKSPLRKKKLTDGQSIQDCIEITS